MKKNIVPLLIAAGLALAGSPAFGEGEKVPVVDPDVKVERPGHGAAVPADNSGKNVRDRADQALTPGDQSSSPADVAITTEIRKAVVADDNLSVNAQNVKIITINGVVTLRGPVKNAAEKNTIATKAQKVAGVSRVDNQIELTGE